MFRNFLIIVLIISHSTIYAENLEKRLVILNSNEAPPFFSKDLPQDGIFGEIIHAISKAAGIDTKIIYKPLSRNIENDTNNDLGDPAFFIDNQDFAAIIPIALSHISLYQYLPNSKKKMEFRSLDDFKGLKIGILKGTLMDRSYFEKNSIFFENSYRQESLFRKLKLGRLDIVIEIELVATQTIKKLFPKEIDKFISTPISDSSYPITIMLSDEILDVGCIVEAYNKGLMDIIEDGSYQNILNKYYTHGKIPYRWFEDLNRFKQLYKMEDDSRCLK